MKTIFDINNDDLVCDSKHIRTICCNPHNHLWAEFRSALNIPPKARKLSLRQSFLLWVASNAYVNGEKELTYSKIAKMGNELLKSKVSLMDDFRILSGSEPIKGREIASLVEYLTGKKVSKRTLYRRCNTDKRRNMIPAFSTEADYSPEQVRRILSAISA